MSHVKLPIVPNPVSVFKTQRELRNASVSEETVGAWLDAFVRVNEGDYMYIPQGNAQGNKEYLVKLTNPEGKEIARVQHHNLHYIYCYLIEVSAILNTPF